MKIGIIGAGNIGGTLAQKFADLGHAVSIANSRGPKTIMRLASDTGATAVRVEDVAKDASLLIITIPLKAVSLLLPKVLHGLAADAVVVDTCNYYPLRDGAIEDIDKGLSESVWVSRQLGHPVVKSFNNIFANALSGGGHPASSTFKRIALPVAGDDLAQKNVVLSLVETMGFDAEGSPRKCIILTPP